MTSVVTVLLFPVTGVPFVALLVVVPRHLIGLQIGLVLALIAAIGGGLSVLFTAGRMWHPSSAEYSVTFVTVRIGLALLGTTAFRADLPHVTVPTLVIHGDGDGVVPFEGFGKPPTRPSRSRGWLCCKVPRTAATSATSTVSTARSSGSSAADPIRCLPVSNISAGATLG